MKPVLCSAVFLAAALAAKAQTPAAAQSGAHPLHSAAANPAHSCVTLTPPDPSCAAFQDLSRRAAEALDVKPAEAVSLYRQALQMEPKWTEGWLYLGATLSQLQRYSEAREAFQKGIPLAPQNGTAWAFLGLCEYELGNKTRALENILKGEALGIAPNPPFEGEIRVRAALVLINSSSFDGALEQLQPVAEKNITPALAIEAAGLAALRMPRPVTELSAQELALVRTTGRATWEFAAQHPAEAKVAFQELLAKYPDKPGVHYLNGIFLADQEPEAALAEFLKELRIDPKNAFAHMQIAFLDLKRGAPEESVVQATEAIKLQPENALAHAALGRACLALNQFPQAVAELERAAKLAPFKAEMQFYLEQAYRRAGRTKDADNARAAYGGLKAQQDPLSLPTAQTPPAGPTTKAP